MPPQDAIHRFGPYELHTRTHELHKHGIKLRLRPQPYQVLKALVERPGDVVTREELRQLLWSTDTFVDFEQGLNTAIKELRAALNDSADEPRYIETLPKVGYRIKVPVGCDLSPSPSPTVPHLEALSVESLPVKEVPPAPVRQAPARRNWILPVAVALLLVAGLAAYVQWSRARTRSRGPSERVMLAVLPFENLTGDPGQDYFSDGLTEEMIAQLGRLDPQRLGVIARTSVMHYKHTQQPLPQIGAELGVQYVLEGSVRRDAGKVRVSAQLIQLKDQAHVWARQYDRELSSLLALQGEIARETADEIHLALGEHNPPEIAARTSGPVPTSEAYDLYLRGLYFWNKRTVPDFQRAIESFQQAIAKDPNYARAYAGLADSYALIGGYSRTPATEFMPKARAAALRALEIDDSLPEAHTALALIVQNYDWDWQTADKEFRRAIELNPNYATAHHWYAEHLMWLGRFDEAFRESEQARQLDPLSLIIAADYGAILYFSRQYDRAIEQFRAVRAMDPDFPRARIIQFAYIEKRMFADALANLENARGLYGEGPWYWSLQAYVYARSGQQERARQALREFERLHRQEQVDLQTISMAYVAVGNGDQALAWLERAYSQHDNLMTTLKVEPAFDPLRADPRFQDLLRRVHLAP